MPSYRFNEIFMLWSTELRQLKFITLLIVLSTSIFLLISESILSSDDGYETNRFETVDFIAPQISDYYCDVITNTSWHPRATDVIHWAERWSYPLPKESVVLSIPTLKQRCHFIKRHFRFNTVPLSREEKEFPLAYGILVHRWFIQVYYMLGAIYHPQNAYCIAVDNKTSTDFKRTIFVLGECFPNIQVINGPTVRHCGNSVLDAVLSCLTLLTSSNNPWKYYQYLSGVDLPLKTNAEMVKIFKRLNGSINAEVLKMVDPPSIADKVRKWIWPKDDIEPTFGMELIKSSLSATFTRETAQFFVNSAQSSALRLFMRKKQLMCPDEYFWLTLAGNPKSVKMPSNFDAARLLKDVERRREIEKLKGGSPSQQSIPYYISRYQRWIEKFNVIISSKPCAGKYIRFSCVFGVRDVSHLLQRPELVAHKFYITFQPAAFFCLNRKIKERALHGHSEFNDEPYGNLPGPRITRKQSVRQWANALL